MSDQLVKQWRGMHETHCKALGRDPSKYGSVYSAVCDRIEELERQLVEARNALKGKP